MNWLSWVCSDKEEDPPYRGFIELGFVPGMSREQRTHLEALVQKMAIRTREKYEAGQREHGGNLWDKGGLLKMAMEEVTDLPVYLQTLMDDLRVYDQAYYDWVMGESDTRPPNRGE